DISCSISATIGPDAHARLEVFCCAAPFLFVPQPHHQPLDMRPQVVRESYCRPERVAQHTSALKWPLAVFPTAGALFRALYAPASLSADCRLLYEERESQHPLLSHPS